VYRQLRAAYWRAAKPELYHRLQEDRARLRPFVPRDGLAFDIGANRGDMSALYQDLGARVIAVEPVPQLAALIRRRFKATVEQAAVGSQPGTGELRLGRDVNHSTMSSAYGARFGERLTEETISVRVTTLDQLMERHGVPDFIKIDVEGFEPEVLRGLTHQIRALSFEFQYDLLDQAEECLRILGRLGDYGFRFAENLLTGSTRLWPDQPTDARTVVDRIRETMSPSSYGDVYAVLSGR
jgi:FkbM family methyltransferase